MCILLLPQLLSQRDEQAFADIKDHHFLKVVTPLSLHPQPSVWCVSL